MRKTRPHKLKKNLPLSQFLLRMTGCAAFGVLASCAFMEPPKSSFDDAGKLTRAEMCQRACTRSHDRCFDASDTRFESYGEPRGVIGMGATCDYDLKNCLKACAKQ